ncbi:MAG: ferrous iron transport protein B [Promethearchaeota archaeon]
MANREQEKHLLIALAGNANVGKSVIFNQLTGLNQTIGNWPGKTVEKAEGNLIFQGYRIKIIDLPGIYSLSTYSIEEIVSREFIANEEIDCVINVIDSTNLERNLFFTYQLLSLEIPLVIALNQYDLLKKKGITIDINKFSELLGVPALPVVAVHGRGVHELLEIAIEIHEGKRKIAPKLIPFGKEVETSLKKIEALIENNNDVQDSLKYPARFIAIKLLEQDKIMVDDVGKIAPEIVKTANEQVRLLQEIHGEEPFVIISSEIYKVAREITDQAVVKAKQTRKQSLGTFLDHLTTHSLWGYVILAGILIGLYLSIFLIGDLIASFFDMVYEGLTSLFPENIMNNIWFQVIWIGVVGSAFSAVGGILPYIFMFYFFIELLQDTGYLPRAAFLMDRIMHVIGLHGKSIIPVILGYGCNVPGCTACRIMETEKERKLTMFVTTLVPCAAVLTVVMGLVSRFVGMTYTILLYLINFSIIALVGRIAYKISGGKSSALILELHEYRMPNWQVILKQTWFRSKEFVQRALLLIIIIGALMEIVGIFGWLTPVNDFLSPVTVNMLGLPKETGVFLIYGILRKELTLVLLDNFATGQGYTTIAGFMSPFQMFNFSLVTMLYVPCVATIITVARESNIKTALLITVVEIGIAIGIGTLVHLIYWLFSTL